MNDPEGRIYRRTPGMSTAKFLQQQQRWGDGLSVETVFGEMEQSARVFGYVVVTKPYVPDPEGGDERPNIYIGAHTRIDDFTKIEGGEGVRIGDYVHIASFVHLNIGGGSLVIGDGAACASGVRIITGGNAPDAMSCSAVAPLDQQVLHRRRVVLEKNACLYAGVLVMPGVTIGEGARVMPGSIVTKNIPPFEIWRGVPARFLRNRTDVSNEGKSWEGLHHCEDCNGTSRETPCPFCVNGVPK